MGKEIIKLISLWEKVNGIGIAGVEVCMATFRCEMSKLQGLGTNSFFGYT